MEVIIEEEEYIDYSCSTPVERLSRDIEVNLRSWHIHNNDRHISISSSRFGKKEEKPHYYYYRYGRSHSEEEVLDEKSSDVRGGKTTVLDRTMTTPMEVCDSTKGGCIRSGNVFYKKVELVLSLWDGPIYTTANHKGGSSSMIPLSLRRKARDAITTVGHHNGHTLSSLFGIGQYITLSPLPRKQEDEAEVDVDVLQMALNIATSNCHCRIPAFSCAKVVSPPAPTRDLSLSYIPYGIRGYCNPGVDISGIGAKFLFMRSNTIPTWVEKGWHALIPVLQRYVGTLSSITLSYIQYRYQWIKDATPTSPKPSAWGAETDPLLKCILHCTWDETNSSLWERADPHLSKARLSITLQWESDLPTSPLSAALRCTLASLVRTSVLEDDVLLHHLSNTAVLQELQQEDISVEFLTPITQKLVGVMDWDECCRDLERMVSERRVEISLNDVFQYFVPIQDEEGGINDAEREQHPALQFEYSCNKQSWFLLNLAETMCKMRTPTAMSALWLQLVEQLRHLWEQKMLIPGLSDGRVSNFTNEKLKSEFLFGNSELDPDLKSCLLAQKFQVFNIGVITTLTTEELRSPRRHRQRSLSFSSQSSYGSLIPPIFSFDSHEHRTQPPQPQPPPTKLTTAESEDIFYDVQEEEEEQKNAFMQSHNGAHSPLPDKTLVQTNDLMYAPYLLRPLPLTSDLLLQRKHMFQRSKSSNHTMLSILHRIQRPKLKSDMMAFKAANPNAILQDFIHWYGDPNESLDENYKLKFKDKDLSGMKKFWAQVWNEAAAQPAKDQTSLFDPAKEVEMVLFFLETMHPALLLNQIMALNLTRAYWILHEASTPYIKPFPTILNSMTLLKQKTQDALDKLNTDVEYVALLMEEHDANKKLRWHVSIETLTACENVCHCVSELEVLLSRIQSLMSKFDEDVELVQKLLACSGDASVGQAVVVQQQQPSGSHVTDLHFLGEPKIREYCLRNEDEEDTPCRLTALLCQDEGMVLALKKCE